MAGAQSKRRKSRCARLDPEVAKAVRAVAEEAAERAAKRAIYRSEAQIKKIMVETMSSLGFVVEDGKDQSEMVADARFLRKLRIDSESRPKKIFFAVFTTFLGVGGALLTYALQQAWNSVFR